MLKNLKNWLLKTILHVGLNSILVTCKWQTCNLEAFESAKKTKKPIFLCCWHSRFILIASYFKKIKLPIWSVSSTHKDSEMMAGVLESWGLRLVRGSSTRGWNHVLKQLIKLFKQDSSIIAVTNDGPKGPPMVAKKGSVVLALKNKVQIIAVSGEVSRYWKLPSWDGTIIPKPFSTIYIQFAEPLNYYESLEGREVEIISDYISNNYNDLNNKNK
jgi:hypothetical protein